MLAFGKWITGGPAGLAFAIRHGIESEFEEEFFIRTFTFTHRTDLHGCVAMDGRE